MRIFFRVSGFVVAFCSLFCTQAMYGFNAFSGKGNCQWVEESVATQYPSTEKASVLCWIDGTDDDGCLTLRYSRSDPDGDVSGVATRLKVVDDKVFVCKSTEGNVRDILLYDFGVKEGDEFELEFGRMVMYMRYVERSVVKYDGVPYETILLDQYLDKDRQQGAGRIRWIVGIGSEYGVLTNCSTDIFSGGGSRLVSVFHDGEKMLGTDLFSLQRQGVFENGTEWTVGCSENDEEIFPPELNSYYCYMVSGSTRFNGKDYFNLKRFGSTPSEEGGVLVARLRVEGNKVYMRHPDSPDAEFLMYDFGARIGDRFTCMGVHDSHVGNQCLANTHFIECVDRTYRTIGDNDYEVMVLQDYTDDTYSQISGPLHEWIVGIGSAGDLCNPGAPLSGGMSVLEKVVHDGSVILDNGNLASVSKVECDQNRCNDLIYGLDGMPVSDEFKGICIQDGKLRIVR